MSAAEISLLREVLVPNAEPSKMGRMLTDAYSSRIPDYNHLEGPVLEWDVAPHAASLTEHFLAFLNNPGQVPDEFVEHLRQSAIRRYHQGISIESLLHSYRMWGSWVLHRIASRKSRGIKIDSDLVLKTAEDIMAFVDYASVIVADAFTSVSASIARDNSRVVQPHLLEPILAGYEGSLANNERFQELARMIAPANVVVVARCLKPQQASMMKFHDMEKIIRHHVEGSEKVLIGRRGYDIVAICPESRRTDAQDLRARCNGLARALTGWLVGVGRTHAGFEGIRTSYHEASQAVDIGVHGASHERAVHFKEVLLQNLVGEGPYTHQIVQEVVGGLTDYDARNGTGLLETLRVYHETRYNLTISGERLRVHPNTVAYRLKRIHETTGFDPEDPNDLLLLILAVKAKSIPPGPTPLN